MVDFKTVAKGMGTFLAGTFYGIITYSIVPELIDYVSGTTLQGIAWTFLIITWTATMLGIPLYLIVEGIRTESEFERMLGIIVAAAYLFLGLALTVVGYFWIPIIANQLTTPLLTALFWIGFTITWIGGIIIAPVVEISQQYSQNA